MVVPLAPSSLDRYTGQVGTLYDASGRVNPRFQQPRHAMHPILVACRLSAAQYLGGVMTQSATATSSPVLCHACGRRLRYVSASPGSSS